ncbi:FG-GAP-like repeat-containing protein [Desulfovibrio sp. JC010]|uniref:FG-GAP-like repeat-containing protein n=1 Tax=Desulfovibrio sp. JC010 TaxID=2593641 RepID=UPI0013D229B8|nr:FG-GAP-like repeat-containing protein [Desulfovibrio sp. JC010]NDV28878.1 VCBS repeat-containing protein [Desulfovibrio sp. JC010]
MAFRRLVIFFIVALFMLTASAAYAQVARTYAVYPFEINGPAQYKYLSRGVQTMLTSRLNWTGHFEPIAGSNDLKEADLPKDKMDEIKKVQTLGVDYIAVGSVVIAGKKASVDVSMINGDGHSWTKSAQTTISELIPAIDGIAQDIKGELFKKPGSKAANEQEQKREEARPDSPMNPEFVTAAGAGKVLESKINPQFRYQGGTETPGRWRSQSMKFVNRGGFVQDVTGDGKKDLVVLTDTDVKVMKIDGQRLKEVVAYKYSNRASGLKVSAIDVDRDGVYEVVLCTEVDRKPFSYILSFKNNSPRVLLDRSKNFLSVIRTPPNFTETIIGQRLDPNRTFYSKHMVEYTFSNGELLLVRKMNVPEFSNVFNLTYLPVKDDDYKIIVLNKYGRINLYDKNLEPLYESAEKFNSSAVSLEIISKALGMNEMKKSERMETMYFIPMPIQVVSISDPNKKEVLLNKDLSIAGQVFSNYKSFAQGEIHSEFWDGVGLNLAWKTRRIKGTVSGYGVADIDNDGDKELYVIMNTYPGSLGIKHRKTLIMAYELNMGQ